MAFAIVAQFPLGAYRAHVGEGEQDLWPSPLRLHAALLAAAGRGTRAVDVDGVLTPSDNSRAALSWLETNPPDGLVLPQRRRRNLATNSTYRDMGLLQPKKRGTKKFVKRDNESIALGGEIMWVWADDPPRDVREVLDELCPDVPYIGQADSPVRLRVESTAPTLTHRRDPAARLGTTRPSDVDLEAPTRGRTAALVEAHAQQMVAKPPTPARDRARTDETDMRTPIVGDSTQRTRYAAVRTERGDPTPWATAWIVPIVDGSRPIAIDRRVAWSVALHRALIAIHGDDAPAVLTGRYHDGVTLPANRVAIQLVDAHPMLRHPFATSQAFLVAIPAGADPGAVAAVSDAVKLLEHVRGPRGRLLTIDLYGKRLVDASRFWLPAEDGHARCWVSFPAVHEVRSPRRMRWTLAHATTLSVALTWRDSLITPEIATLGREERFRELIDAARGHDVEVFDVRRLATSDVDRYVHKVPSGHVVQPYVATVGLGSLAVQGTLAAIGQSRHLGGGLLTPINVPEPLLDVWRHG